MKSAIAWLEKETGKKFGDTKNPLLVSVRSGARDSMPGMMDTILNLGLNDKTVEALKAATGNGRFAWDCYRRFVQMYGDVVMGVQKRHENEHEPFDEVMDELKHEARSDRRHAAQRSRSARAGQAIQGAHQGAHRQGIPERSDRAAARRDRRRVRLVDERSGDRLSPEVQNSRRMGHGRQRAEHGLRQHGRRLRHRRGLHARSGDRRERFLRRIPGQRPGRRRRRRRAHAEAVAEMAKDPIIGPAYKELEKVRKTLEKNFGDVQDFEFTIEKKKLFMLQTRNGKRTARGLREDRARHGEGRTDDAGARDSLAATPKLSINCCSRFSIAPITSTPRTKAA